LEHEIKLMATNVKVIGQELEDFLIENISDKYIVGKVTELTKNQNFVYEKETDKVLFAFQPTKRYYRKVKFFVDKRELNSEGNYLKLNWLVRNETFPKDYVGDEFFNEELYTIRETTMHRKAIRLLSKDLLTSVYILHDEVCSDKTNKVFNQIEFEISWDLKGGADDLVKTVLNALRFSQNEKYKDLIIRTVNYENSEELEKSNLAKIICDPNSNKPSIVSLSGCHGVGKTTFTDTLKLSRENCILSWDKSPHLIYSKDTGIRAVQFITNYFEKMRYYESVPKNIFMTYYLDRSYLDLFAYDMSRQEIISQEIEEFVQTNLLAMDEAFSHLITKLLILTADEETIKSTSVKPELNFMLKPVIASFLALVDERKSLGLEVEVLQLR